MAEKNNNFSSKDSFDIAELASLNDDISPELIEQLQQKIQEDSKGFSNNVNNELSLNDSGKVDDENLFEETQNVNTDSNKTIDVNDSNQITDDKFLMKYNEKKAMQIGQNDNDVQEKPSISDEAFQPLNDIEQVSNGNITEKAISSEQINYNDSLDFLDGNVKYSKYVIYIDPQNVDFIEHLTVKERKNLINKILREQDDIAITKQRFKIIQTVIRHAIVAIITVALSIPLIYITINASLETTINNYRRSQSFFQTLYRENGKITQYKKY